MVSLSNHAASPLHITPENPVHPGKNPSLPLSLDGRGEGVRVNPPLILSLSKDACHRKEPNRSS